MKVDVCPELKKAVEALEKAEDFEESVIDLQKIESILLGCEILIVEGDNPIVTIHPKLVEAYYRNSNKHFDDINVHEDPLQKGETNFGQLYLHGGVDVCLPLHDGYYLSFLIKNAYTNSNSGELKSVLKILEGVTLGSGVALNKTNVESCSVIIRLSDLPTDVVFVPRKNVFGRMTTVPLAAFTESTLQDICDKASNETDNKRRATEFEKLTLATGYGKQWKLSMLSLLSAWNVNIDDETLSKLKEQADQKNGSGGRISHQYWELAIETMKTMAEYQTKAGLL